MTKKIYIIIGVVFLAVAGFLLLRNEKEEQSFETVEKGTLTQEIFESGSTEKGEDVNLGFKEGGRVNSVYVREGESVSRGEVIAELDREELQISLREARASLSSAEANLQKVLEGASTEELNLVSTTVSSAEKNLISAEEALEDQERLAEEMLKNAHQNTSTFLGNVFMSVKEVKDDVVDFSKEYFSSFVVSETASGRKSRDSIRRSVGEIEEYRDIVQRDVDFEEKKKALVETEKQLKIILGELDNLIDVAESDFYEDRVTQADKTLLKTHRNTVNTYAAETASLIGSISSVEAETNSLLNQAKASVISAESNLDTAKAELSKVEAGSGDADTKSARAAIDQASARVDLIQKRIREATLRSPVSGTVSSVLAREGEVISPGAPVAIVVPDKDIQISVDIYEGDVASISVGNPVKASFVAFPNRDFEGEVTFINPTGKISDGVVYYEVKIILDEYPENILPRMTVDVTIQTAQKEGVLILPDRDIQRREGRYFVNVLENGRVVEKEVELGITGEGRRVEIITGLKEGEKILTQ